MSDTVIIEEEKDIEHIAERKVAVIRKKMMAAFCVMAGIAILIAVVTTGFYELKFRALAAGLYNIDNKSGEYLIDMMFYNRYSLSDVTKYGDAIMECGYTENGASYVFQEWSVGNCNWGNDYNCSNGGSMYKDDCKNRT